jgi:DNA-binding response OmpR family regulator
MSTILVIDDEKGITRIIQEVLTKTGHRVEIAANGMEGIQKFDDGRFDMVITDIRMPGIDGKGVLQHIRRSARQTTPIIGISGTPWLLKEADFDMILSKPFPLKELVDSVKNLVHVSSPATATA